MPFSRIFLRKGKSAAYKQAIFDGLYLAMRETFDVPENDRFMAVSELEVEDFNYDRHYVGMNRSDDFVIIQLTVSNTRPRARKQALYRRIVEHLSTKPGINPQDIFINLVEVLPENWSFGDGLAQYVKEDA